jgi:hypothetical protein
VVLPDAADPIGDELRALFDLALDDEPPSAVTPLGVLRRAKLAAADRRERRAGQVRRWGGGLLAAAAVLALVLVVGPTLGNHSASTASDGVASGSAASGSAAAGYAVGSAEAGEASGGTAGAGSAGSSAAGGAAQGSASSGTGSSGTGSGAADASGSGRSGGTPGTPDQAAPHGSSISAPAQAQSGGSKAAASEAAPTAAATNSREPATDTAACAWPPLRPAERAAAIGALPDGTVTGVTAVATCRSGSLRGAVLHLRWSSATVTVMVTSAGSAAPATSAGGDGQVSGSYPSGSTIVTALADPAAVAHLPPDTVDAVARAVAAARR